ncbi:MAG TPA: DUF2167 domain-containing protein [Fibrobacteria bacterium]|nr:DUF2167 domain-containing protein [Fibrobacteria bacterium]HOX50362.1 DUF2167 domain-containing protein [Fibrobacteria bacterium]
MNILPALVSFFLAVPDSGADTARAWEEDSLRVALDSTLAGLEWRTGRVVLAGGKVEFSLPKGYRYLDSAQARKVLVDLWGNPSFAADNQSGMVFAPGQEPVGADSWSVVVSYDDQGHVDDKDAASINYDELLTALQRAVQETNAERVAGGADPQMLVGWAERPTYDAATKTLFWAKEFRQGPGENRLNYGVRILGREGILCLSAVGRMGNLKEMKAGMRELFSYARFTPGNTYADFQSGDKVSRLDLSLLVAGGAHVAAKSGFLKVFLAGVLAGRSWVWIVALVVLAGLFVLYRKLSGKAAERRIGADATGSP